MTTVPRAGLRDALALTRAWVWLVLGRPERGLGVLERAQGRGAHGMLHRHRAGLLSLLGRRDEALEALEGALRFDPLDGTTRIEAVETLVRWGWDKDRIAAFMDEYGGPVEGNKRSFQGTDGRFGE